MDENEKITEQEVAEFLAHWQDFMDSDHMLDIQEIDKALSYLRPFPRIECREFVLACLSHTNSGVRINAYGTWGLYIRHFNFSDDVRNLFDAIELETNDFALGASSR